MLYVFIDPKVYISLSGLIELRFLWAPCEEHEGVNDLEIFENDLRHEPPVKSYIMLSLFIRHCEKSAIKPSSLKLTISRHVATIYSASSLYLYRSNPYCNINGKLYTIRTSRR